MPSPWPNQICRYCGEPCDEREVRGEHKWSESIELPGCTLPGWKESICSVCGESKGYGKEIPPTGQDWSSWEWVQGTPSCNEDGLQVRTCSRCRDREEREVKGGSHQWADWVEIKAATCTERGEKIRYCNRCGEDEMLYIPVVDHIYGEWYVIEEPQVGIPGVERRSCTFDCGTHTQSFCSVHSFPFAMIDALLQGKDTAEAWTMVRQIWGVELTKAYNQLSAKLGNSNILATIEYKMMTQWMMAHEASLIALYPNSPELVAQEMVKIIMERVNDLCQVTK